MTMWLDVTWLQDANYAQTSGYKADGKMNWLDALAWADGLSVYDSVRNVTYDDWRLPTTLQVDSSCSFPQGAVYVGYDCTGSEMGHLYNVDGTQLSLFTNLQTPYYYRSATEYAPYNDVAWMFDFDDGYQTGGPKNADYYALAVRDGDVGPSVVPIPAAVWLFGSGLGLLGWLRRRQTA